MWRFKFLFALVIFTKTNLAAGSSLKNIGDSPALREVMDVIARAYARGPNFNGFYWSDEFSLFVIESRQPSFSWVDREEITKQFNLLIENALKWGSENDKKFIKEKKLQAIDDLKKILGEKKFKRYSDTIQRGNEFRLETYYVAKEYQLWFEETLVD